MVGCGYHRPHESANRLTISLDTSKESASDTTIQHKTKKNTVITVQRASMSDDKLALKQAELSVQRFQDMAVPHHLGLLQNHRSNIEKSLALGDWQKIKKEELNAMRVIKQIKNLLLEMDALREKLREEDQPRFDELMKPGRAKAFEGMNKFAGKTL